MTPTPETGSPEGMTTTPAIILPNTTGGTGSATGGGRGNGPAGSGSAGGGAGN
jgi:hypothetical protein